MPEKARNATSAAIDAAAVGSGNRCTRKYGKTMNTPMASALKTACAAMTMTLIASSFRRWMKSAVRMVQGAMHGRMYPGSLEREMEKNKMGKIVQMTRNSG